MSRFTASEIGETVLLRCAGRFVTGDVDRLRHAIHGRSQTRTIVLDLAEINIMDAAGVGILASLRAGAHAAGRKFKLMNLSPGVELILKMTRRWSGLEVCSVPEMLDLLCDVITQAEAKGAVSLRQNPKLQASTV